MEYELDIRKFRKDRGVSRMKFCELSDHLDPIDLKTVEEGYSRGKVRGDSDTIALIKDTVAFIEGHDIRVRTGGDRFQITWRKGDREMTETAGHSKRLDRRIFL